MTGFFAHLGIWNWFILGALLLAVEVLVPGAFMVWFGMAAIAVGLLSLVIDWPWQAQIVAYSALSVGSILVWRQLSGRAADEPPPSQFLNRRAESLVGRTYTLDKPIVDGSGALKIGDTFWMVRGPDLPAGSRVRITGAEGNVLHIAREKD